MTDASYLTPTGFLCLDIPGASDTEVWCGSLRLRTVSDPKRAGRVEVPLPGWIWRDIPPGDPAWIRWDDQAFAVPRARVESRLKELTKHPVATWNAAALVGALDHIHHGAIGTVDAGTPLATWLDEAAEATGLVKLRPETFASPALLPGQAAIATFGANLQGGSGDRTKTTQSDSSLMSALMEALRFAPDIAAREALVLAVLPEFCHHDSLKDLITQLDMRGIDTTWRHAPAPWARAQALALALAANEPLQVRQFLAKITANPKDWVATPALAWALRHAASDAGRALPTDLRLALIDDLTRFAEARAPLPCTEMIRAQIFLFEHMENKLPSDLAESIIWRSLRAYGTSSLLWQGVARLAAAGIALPAEILTGEQAFRMLEQGAQTGDPAHGRWLISMGLRRLRNLGVVGLQRLETELLGSNEPDKYAMFRAFGEGHNGALEILRQALIPTKSRPSSDALRDTTLLKALRWAERDVPNAPFADLQRRAMGAARALTAPRAPDAIVDAQKPYTTQQRIETLMHLLAQLLGPEAGYYGIGIACALLADLASSADANQATLSALLPEVRALLHGLPALPAPSDNPFLRSALARLQAALRSAPILTTIADQLPLLPADVVNTSLRRPAGLPLGPALTDTLVVVVSCRAFLDTRVAALRRGWLAELNQMGVPHVILVGGEETRLVGDILEVAAPDTYEGLPQKILAMIAWVRSETGFAHVLKIDDDCHVDPVAWFGDGLWRQAEWYGRRLDKTGPLAERDWHQSRSQDEVAQLSFETLPLHGVYTDGSTGYALSRNAMDALVTAMDEIEGRRIIAGAFSEDRLIGSLLTRAGFAPNSHNYYSLILRKSHPAGRAVPQWAESIMPNDRLRHTKVVHFDGVVPVTEIEAARRSPRLLPSRIWPADRLPNMGYDNGSLMLISPPERLTLARTASVAVVSVVRNERVILPHFLDHYRKLGVPAFLIADNLSDDGTLEYLIEQPDVALFSVAGQFRSTNQGTDWKRALMGQVRLNRWTLVADADEFLLLPEGTSLPQHIEALPEAVNAQRVLMQDMYAPGTLAQADFSQTPPFEAAPLSDPEPFLRNSIWRGPFSNGETLTSALRHRLMPGSRADAFVAQKTPLLRYLPWMQLSTSLHYASEVNQAADDLIFAHFKYNAGFATKAASEVKRGQYWNNAEEYRAYFATGFGDASG